MTWHRDRGEDVRLIKSGTASRGARLVIVAKAMKRRDVGRALRRAGCAVKNDDGPHTTWLCPCGQHTADIPRHADISPGVVRDTMSRMTCLPKGWLQ